MLPVSLRNRNRRRLAIACGSVGVAGVRFVRGGVLPGAVPLAVPQPQLAQAFTQESHGGHPLKNRARACCGIAMPVARAFSSTLQK